MSFQQKKRAMTPKGQMSGNGSGPAIMMMPPHIRATFMPDPPLKHLPAFTRHVLVSENYITDDDDDDNDNDYNDDDAIKKGRRMGPSGISLIPTSFPKLKRGAGLTGVSTFLHQFEQTPPPPRKIDPTPKSLRDAKRRASKAANDAKLAPLIEKYRREQRECGGEFTNGMNCYNTLFVGRLAYEVTERKLLREMEAYGPVKDIKLVTDTITGRSRGYAFVEYEHEEDMKRAYRAADGMRLEGRAIVADVERGHTVPNWLPRKLGGGLGGGSRSGGPSFGNKGGGGGASGMVGRFDPMMGQPHQQLPFGNNNAMMGGPGPGPGPMMGGGGGPPTYGRPPVSGRGGGGGGGGPPPASSSYGGGGRGGGYGDRGGGGYYGSGGGPPPSYGGYRESRGPPPPSSGPYGGGGVGYNTGPPPLAWERGGGAAVAGGGGGTTRGYDGDRKRRRSRSRSPDSRRRR